MSKGKRKETQKQKKLVVTILSCLIVLGLILLGANEDIIKTVSNILNVDANFIINQQESKDIQDGENTETAQNLAIYFIDVGQADSILIMNKEQSMLIDAGNNDDGEKVVEFIKSKGITTLQYVIGTHPHEDHIGGLDTVINSDIVVQNVFMPKIQTNTKTFEEVLDAVANKNLKIKAPQKGDTFQIGDANCEVMTDSILDEKNLNLSSIVVQLTYGEKRFLFMGDAETENEKTRQWEKVDVLKVGHHGSKTSSSSDFLKQITPTYAIIMAGENNSYGLPKAEIVERLENMGANVYRTDKDGTITIVSDGNSVKIFKNS